MCFSIPSASFIAPREKKSGEGKNQEISDVGEEKLCCFCDVERK
jgi:hypothetical protein